MRFGGAPEGQNPRHERAVREHQGLMQVLESTFTGASGLFEARKARKGVCTVACVDGEAPTMWVGVVIRVWPMV